LKVDFVIGGTQKGGTTALARFVGAHPQIAFSSQKETHFFDRDALFRDGDPDWAIYYRYFQPGPEARIAGEATPIYLYWNPCAERIARYNPEMKWIVLLRNPIERAYSHWVMETERGDEILPFGQAIRAERDRLAKAGGQHRIWSYVDRGRYAGQLERLFERFGRERVLVLVSEELRRRHAPTLDRVWSFLGVDRIEVPAASVFAQWYQSMDEGDRDWLLQELGPEIDRLERLIDLDLSDWRRLPERLPRTD
jgi:hypothetical protein